MAQGERLYQSNCAPCHGPRGEGGSGARLADSRVLGAYRDPELFLLIRSGKPGTQMPGTRHLTDQNIQQIIRFLRALARAPEPNAAGDAARGEQLYRGKGACADCHMIRGQGGVTGPDLTDIGARRGAGYLWTSLVEPEADVPENFLVYRWYLPLPDSFLQVQVTTADGRVITGVRVNEDPFSIQVRDFSGRIHSFWRRDLKEVREDWGKSPMPGYRDRLTKAELEDLVAYLVRLRGQP